MNKKMVASIFAASLVVGALSFQLIPTLLGKELIHSDGSIPYKDKTTLVGEADVIVSGTVSEVLLSKWSNPGGSRGAEVSNILQTDIVVSVNKTFKGNPTKSDSVVIRIDSGETKDVKVISEGYPSFEKGEEVLVFLSRDDSDVANTKEDYYILTGMLQGKYNLKEKNADKKIFKGVRDEIDPSTFTNEIPNEIEKFKDRPKMKDAKLYQP
ncbi:hypothetical protein GCM10008018_65820 [Paenibacillus marchantiophytorum]|uniref:Flp pilus assembly protein CpaB n=1 Tax=Paenibacillus marchantiophytorum TaxID=1619310 RepID=A0ABQ1FGH2_9BACL|nr:hypothetical protein [Paenibacillus marchantiophytorum]GGA11588.1 hypothetical protein GCM10008018_65820 [Paenibacillus marchantiophytorum]